MYLREQSGDMAVGTKVFGYVAKFPTGGTNIPNTEGIVSNNPYSAEFCTKEECLWLHKRSTVGTADIQKVVGPAPCESGYMFIRTIHSGGSAFCSIS